MFAAWTDEREDPDLKQLEIEGRSKQEGWTPTLIREFAQIYRPQIEVKAAFGLPSPLLWTVDDTPERVVSVGVNYPCPNQSLALPDQQIGYAVSQFRESLELGVALEREIGGNDRLHFQTTHVGDGGPELSNNSYGLTGLIVHFQKLMAQFAAVDKVAARTEVQRWSTTDDYVFARLRIWAAGSKFLASEAAGAIFLSLSEFAFWGAFHERDLLFALRNGWADLSHDDRVALEQRLLTGGYPYDLSVSCGDRERAIVHDRLN